MPWNYKREEKSGFDSHIPEGRHRIRIKDANKAVSSTGNEMLVLKFEVSGFNELVFHYITFMKDKPEFTNQKLTEFFDSFKDIKEGDFDMNHWIGCTGACTIKHEDYQNNTKSKVGYFINKDKQGDLPAWKEADGRQADADGFMNVPEGIKEELPF